MKNLNFRIFFAFCLLIAGMVWPIQAQTAEALPLPGEGGKVLLNQGWMARRANELLTDGNRLTMAPITETGWIKARVPGTVLTTLLENDVFPAPEFSLNNNLIPDIYNVGSDFYTFWFAKQFEMPAVPAGKHVWLNFRGINYKAEIYLNGKRVNNSTHEGMFLRKSFEITPYLKKSGTNVLAVIVYPPDQVGNPNGGQGGDGLIARNVTMQYTPGWDWIQPVRDRNTGIWDEVSITMTGPVRVQHPYVVTKVPGTRVPGGNQKDATVQTAVEVENVTDQPQNGTLVCETNGQRLTAAVSLAPGEKKEVALKDLVVKNPKLWWPNTVGDQPLYDMKIFFQSGSGISDSHSLQYGIREIATEKDPVTGGRKFYVNGQKIYMTGGNYINSDWLLRLTPERYEAEVRFHAEMNLRMIRVWGGALLERPEFYQACDKYGILVFQDLWGSGDCNGAWEDPMKVDSRQRRQEYPDNHDLFLTSVEDQVKMIRNHPSLCMWCGANEWPLAKDIDHQLKTDVFPRLDPNRLFASYSTDDEFTKNLLKDNGDGPYGIQELDWFFTFRSHPFNPEAGSVGSPEVESLREMFTERELRMFPRVIPGMRGGMRNTAWQYHKDLGYGDHLTRYGKLNTVEDYARTAQVANYDQYRSFMEGWNSHMWDWYTGILIWKTQNPWTALRGQMYDWFLDVNATLYGTRKGCEPQHAQYNLVTKQVELVNSGVTDWKDAVIHARILDRTGKVIWQTDQKDLTVPANSLQTVFEIPQPEGVEGVYFLELRYGADKGDAVTSNVYWLTTKEKDYTTLESLPKTKPEVKAQLQKQGNAYAGTVTLKATDGISFFNRVKVFDNRTGKRILPVHYSDNYLTLMPGHEQTISVYIPGTDVAKNDIGIVVDSWTSDRIQVPVH